MSRKRLIFFSSDAPAFTVGSDLVIDGGWPPALKGHIAQLLNITGKGETSETTAIPLVISSFRHSDRHGVFFAVPLSKDT